MIIGKKEELDRYRALNPNLSIAIDYLLAFQPETPDGSYELAGQKVYAVVMTQKTKMPEKMVYEAHRKYIDLQYIVHGEEELGYAAVSDCEIDTPYDEAQDYLLVKGEGSEIKLSDGDFYIAYPSDGHRPLCSSNPAEIRKIVVKAML